MSIKYYYSILSPDSESGDRQYRLFAVIEDSWYWAIEWKTSGIDSPSILTDFNTGYMSRTVKQTLSTLTEIEPPQLRSRFGTFADYIERAASGFRSYISWICPDSEMKNIVWQISEA